MSRTFKILVIEDKAMHRESAKATLAGHDVTIVSSFDEAMDLMKLGSDTVNFFDVVLTDMMMPMSWRTLGDSVGNLGEQPYGFIIALRAALCGAKFIAMLTDTNHHRGPMSAALDHVGGAYYDEGQKPNFVINDAHVMFVHTPFYHEVLGKKTCDSCNGTCVCKYCNGKGRRFISYMQRESSCNVCGVGKNDDETGTGKCGCEGTGKVDDVRNDRKDWGKVLTDLTAE